MNFTLFFTLFTLLTIIYFLVGWYASRRVKNTTDYYLAGRDLGFMTLTGTLIATQLGGGMLIGTAQKAYTQGYWSIMYVCGMSLGFLILALGFAGKLRSLNVSTTAELFETRYNSVTLKKIASLLSIFTLCGLFIAQIAASRSLLMSMGIENELFFCGFWAFVIAYTIIGGLHAVALVDALQVSIIIVVFVLLFLATLWQEPTSLMHFLVVTQEKISLMQGSVPLAVLLPTLVFPALFSLIEQDLAQRFFAARTRAIAASSALTACFFMLIFAFIPIYFGMKAHSLVLSAAAMNSPLIPTIEIITGGGLAALALCAIIAAITSTADALLCAISSNITQDFEFAFLQKYVKNKLSFAKYITFITGFVAFICSYIAGTNVIDILVNSYGISVNCIFVSLVVCLFKKNVSLYAAWTSVFAGLVGYIAFQLWPVPYDSFISLGMSAIGYVGGSLIHTVVKNNK